jgi:hypothetical protein
VKCTAGAGVCLGSVGSMHPVAGHLSAVVGSGESHSHEDDGRGIATRVPGAIAVPGILGDNGSERTERTMGNRVIA